MKFSRLSVLFIAAIVATSVLASTSKAQALTWALNNVKFTGGNATGVFDYDQTSNTYSNINIQIVKDYNGFPDPVTFTQTDTHSGNVNTFTISSSTISLGHQLTLNFTSSLAGSSSLVTGKYTILDYIADDQFDYSVKGGSSVSVVPVPFDIPGGATIPAVGGLLALGLMRKARKSLASNTRISEPISEMVS